MLAEGHACKIFYALLYIISALISRIESKLNLIYYTTEMKEKNK